MKKLLLFLVLILILTFSSLGQDKQVSIEEFDLIESRAYKNLKEEPYCTMTIVEKFDSKTLALKSISTSLYETKNPNYQYSSETFESNGKKSRTEYLGVDNSIL